MSFEHSSTVTTSASARDVWALWKDPGCWCHWDPRVESVAMEGHFAEGAAGQMVLEGGVSVPMSIEVVEPGKRFLDRLSMDGLVIEIDHVVRPVDGGSEVTVSTYVSGPGADDVGAMVTADAPQAMEALVAMAEGRA